MRDLIVVVIAAALLWIGTVVVRLRMNRTKFFWTEAARQRWHEEEAERQDKEAEQEWERKQQKVTELEQKANESLRDIADALSDPNDPTLGATRQGKAVPSAAVKGHKSHHR